MYLSAQVTQESPSTKAGLPKQRYAGVQEIQLVEVTGLVTGLLGLLTQAIS